MEQQEVAVEMEHESSPFKINDRVRRKAEGGCAGVVQEVRKELALSSAGNKDSLSSWMIKVLWDNGTASYFDPESLESL